MMFSFIHDIQLISFDCDYVAAVSTYSCDSDNRHEMLFELCKTLVRQSDADWTKAVQCCSDAADLNPLDSVTLTSIALGAPIHCLHSSTEGMFSSPPLT
jgi:hypothetical protein